MCVSVMCVFCTTAWVQSVETSFLFLRTIKNESESEHIITIDKSRLSHTHSPKSNAEDVPSCRHHQIPPLFNCLVGQQTAISLSLTWKH